MISGHQPPVLKRPGPRVSLARASSEVWTLDPLAPPHLLCHSMCQKARIAWGGGYMALVLRQVIFGILGPSLKGCLEPQRYTHVHMSGVGDGVGGCFLVANGLIKHHPGFEASSDAAMLKIAKSVITL